MSPAQDSIKDFFSKSKIRQTGADTCCADGQQVAQVAQPALAPSRNS